MLKKGYRDKCLFMDLWTSLVTKKLSGYSVMIILKKLKWIIVVLGSGVVVLFFLFTPFLIKTFIVQAFKTPTSSMKPTIMVGDFFLTDKTYVRTNRIKREDVLIFKYPIDPSKIYIKRAIGLPGDTIEIKNKKLYIDEVLYEEDYVIHIHDYIYNASENKRDNFGPVVVPENHFFMMGDNRDRSNDSRFWGFLSLNNIKGKAIFVYWSWDETKFRVRWNRIGKHLH